MHVSRLATEDDAPIPAASPCPELPIPADREPNLPTIRSPASAANSGYTTDVSGDENLRSEANTAASLTGYDPRQQIHASPEHCAIAHTC